MHSRALRSSLFVSIALTLAACGDGGASSDGGATPADERATDATAVVEDAVEPPADSPAEEPDAEPPTDAAPPPDAPAPDPGAWPEMLDAINEARSQARMCGSTMMPAVPPLTWNAQLAAAARGHSEHMVSTGCFSHDMTGSQACSDGTMCTRIVAAGYRWSRLGENIAAGQNSVASVMAGWLQSAGHCSNIMSAGFREVGAGLAMGGRLRNYWTQNFGTGGSASSCR